MTPNARIAAAMAVLDSILEGMPAEQALLRWSRGARYAGSGDRAAVRDLVFDSLRRRNSRAMLGGSLSGAGLMLGMCREKGIDPSTVFTGQGHDPAAIAVLSGDFPGSPLTDLPDWLVPDWTASLGADAEPVAAAMQDRAPVWLRVNPLRGSVDQARQLLDEDRIQTREAAELGGALEVVSGERRLSGSRAYGQGLVELQDLSAQIACSRLPLNADARVLDYCAGGGGKALALAGRGVAELVAHDANPRRMADLPMRAERAAAKILTTARPQGPFDAVITDVPCSGSGTWRRTPDAKWRLTRADLQALLRVQAEILECARLFLRPGGVLAYMTCSVLEQENRAQIDAFLDRHHDFMLLAAQTLTPLNASDGFFWAVIQYVGVEAAKNEAR